MNVKINEMELNRINELRLRALILKLLRRTNNNLYLVIEYIKHINNFIDFNLQAIIDIVKEIIEDRFAPTTNELIKINLLLGLTIREIAQKLNMKESTIKMRIYRNKYNVNSIIIYPRLKKEQLEELRKFLKQYYSLYVPINSVYKT
ncbi:MAG: hypothetical protein IJ223_03640 [Clostridia bacterium]|nr:hypothetical protein [Clostridia bacterium]